MENVERKNPLFTTGEGENYSHCGNYFGGSSQIKNITTICSKYFITGNIYRKHHRDIYTPMYIVTLFTIARKWKYFSPQSTDEWIMNIWYIYKMEYQSTLKKNAITKFTGEWIDLEHIIFSEVTQSQNLKIQKYSACSPCMQLLAHNIHMYMCK